MTRHHPVPLLTLTAIVVAGKTIGEGPFENGYPQRAGFRLDLRKGAKRFSQKFTIDVCQQNDITSS